MTQWEFCQVEYNGKVATVLFFDEAGDYVLLPTRHAQVGIQLAKLGHDGWELVSTWWGSGEQVIHLLKRPCQSEWTEADRNAAQEKYEWKFPMDTKY